MQPSMGEILEGKVTSITGFGAFVLLPQGNSGLVHISEIANSFVNDIHEHLSEGQTVKVKVIGINEAGKINLSIRKAQPAQPEPQFRKGQNDFQNRSSRPQASQFQRNASNAPRSAANDLDSSFEDKLKQFMQDSDSRIAGNRMYADKKSSSRRRKN